MPGPISHIGVLVLLTGYVVVHVLRRRPPTWLEWSLKAILIVGALAMYLHLMPGFRNPLLLNRVQVSVDAIPFSMYLNLDKMAAAILLALAFIQLPQLQWRKILKTVGVCLPLLVFALGPMALFSGYVRWDPKVPSFALLWMFNNLFLVCVSEEILFRGVIQGRLYKLLSDNKLAAPLAIGVGALAFGLAHYQGGLKYMILATVAGIFYGIAYQRTGRLEAPILVHFGLNAFHFFLFTYPALANVL